MTYQQIIAKLNELKITPHDMHRGEMDIENEEGETTEVDVEELVTKEIGSFEDVGTDKAYDGKSTQVVYFFKEHDVYIGFDYTYSSWGDSDFSDDFYEVRPQTESVVRYAEVKK